MTKIQLYQLSRMIESIISILPCRRQQRRWPILNLDRDRCIWDRGSIQKIHCKLLLTDWYNQNFQAIGNLEKGELLRNSSHCQNTFQMVWKLFRWCGKFPWPACPHFHCAFKVEEWICKLVLLSVFLCQCKTSPLIQSPPYATTLIFNEDKPIYVRQLLIKTK